MPFFSVVVLAWNVEKYIEECLKSIEEQTFSDFEAIVMVPRCDDGSLRICEAFAISHNRFRVFSIENSGQNQNRIEGWKRAQGNYLLCVDGDDVWDRTLLQIVYDNVKNIPYDIVIFGHRRYNDRGVISENKNIFKDKEVFWGAKKTYIYEKYIKGGPINEIWAKAWKRELLSAVMVELEKMPKLRHSEDLLISCILTDQAKTIQYIDRCLYNYRIHSNSIIHSFSESEIIDHMYVKEKVKDFMAKWQMDTSYYVDFFYNNIASYTADWIFRCALSDISYAKKTELYNWLEVESPFFDKTKNRIKYVSVKGKIRVFVILFFLNKWLLELYARLYKSLKRVYYG